MLLRITMLLAASMLLAGCHTIAGFGKDVRSAGQAIERAAQ